MNEGVKILLERMKTNPEEFIVSEGYPYEVGSGSKWHKLIESHKLYLNPEDNKVLEEALNGLMQQRFTERVMKELLAPEEDDSLGKPWYSKQSAMPLGGATQGVTLSSGAISGTVTYNDQLAHELAHVKACLDIEKEKQKTLFGRLFNYQ
jgi:hypothetical protein